MIFVGKKHNTAEIALWVLFVLLLLLFYRRDIGNQDFSKMFFVLPIVGYALFAPRQYIVYLLALIMPLSFGLSTGYIFPIVLLFYFLKKKELPVRTLVFVLALMALEYIHYPFYDFEAKADLSTVLNYFSAWFIVAYFIFHADKKVDIDKFLFWFSLATVILCLFVSWHSIMIFDTTGYEMDEVRVGTVGMKGDLEDGKIFLRANPNTLGFYSVTAISLLLIQIIRKKMNTWIAFGMIALLVVTGGLTMSRTWLVLLVFNVMVFMALSSKNGLKAVLFSFVILGMFALILFFAGDYLDVFMDRFKGDKTMSGRTDIFGFYHNAFISNLDIFLIGAGAIHYMDALHYDHATHNGIQQILICYGITGFTMILLPLVMRFNNLRRKMSCVGGGYFILRPNTYCGCVFTDLTEHYTPAVNVPAYPRILGFNFKD